MISAFYLRDKSLKLLDFKHRLTLKIFRRKTLLIFKLKIENNKKYEYLLRNIQTETDEKSLNSKRPFSNLDQSPFTKFIYELHQTT